MDITILLVEDDPFLQDGLQEVLRREGYQITLADSCAAANQYIRNSYHLVILDVTLPDGNGYQLCDTWRKSGISTPILFLTARDDEMDVVHGLDAGGDDYVTKPFRLQELLSRIRALLRRSRTGQHSYRVGSLLIDFDKHMVLQNEKPLLLTPTEFQLLSVMVRHRNQTLTRAQLLQSIWDDAGTYIEDNTLSVHISRLREKLNEDYIHTVRGIGYQWKDTP